MDPITSPNTLSTSTTGTTPPAIPPVQPVTSNPVTPVGTQSTPATVAAIPMDKIISIIANKPIPPDDATNNQIQAQYASQIKTDPLINQKIPPATTDGDKKLYSALKSNSYSAILSGIQKSIDAAKADYTQQLQDLNTASANVNSTLDAATAGATAFDPNSVRVQREQAINTLRKSSIQNKLLNSQNQNAQSNALKGL